MKFWQQAIRKTWLWKAPFPRWRKCLALLGILILFGYSSIGLYLTYWLVPLDPEFVGGRYYYFGIPFNASFHFYFFMTVFSLCIAYMGIFRGPKTKRPRN